MDTNRFDTFTMSFARRMNRRGALAAGGAGLGAAIASRFSSAGFAQEATPVTGATPIATDQVEVLFVQSFASGTLVENDANDGSFTLTLENGTGQTVYFSDRPDRIVGTLTDVQFLDGRAFDPADPPNAALVAKTADNEDILIVELSDPALDATSGTVSYTVRVLKEPSQSVTLASIATRQTDDTIGGDFGPVTLFIDQLACTPAGGGCKSNSSCCSGYCCEDIEECPPWECM